MNAISRRAPSRCARLVLAASVLLAVAACGKKGGDEGDDEANVTPVVAVQTATVTLAPFAPTVRAVGTVVSSPRGYAELSAPAASRVSRVFVTAGQAVSEGQDLVALDAASLAASAAGATAARQAAQAAYDRAVTLSKEGILPRKAVDQAASDLAQANAADVAARRTYALSTLRAPIAGVVTKMNAVTGASVDPTQVLVAIADPRSLQLLFGVSPSDAGGVKPGARITLYESETPSAQSLGTAAVSTVGAAIDTSTRAVPVRATITSTSRPLRLGETIVGRIATAGVARAVAIPSAALVPDSSGTFKVYVVTNGLARSVPVEIGTRGDSVVEITKGLTPGQVVVTTGAYGLEDSSKVTVTKR